MKKIIVSVVTLCIACSSFSQTIPNGGFENWTITNYENPQSYSTSNMNSSDKSNVVNVIKTNDKFHGQYAIQLTTTISGTDTAFAFFSNGDPGKNPAKGGLPYAQMPTGIRLRYKSNIVGTDSAIVIVIFKKAGANIAQYFYKIGSTKTAYTLFKKTFSPVLTITPDSIVFAVASSNAFIGRGNPGNMIQVDSVALTGAFQPMDFNGDLEVWDSKSASRLNGWGEVSGGDPSVDFITTDKYSGTYALELQTNLPKFGGGGGIHPGVASTGTSGQNGPQGGYPYNKQIDTLVFYYRYLPANPSDSARVFIGFSAGGVDQGGIDKRLGIAAGPYTKVQIPFNLPQIPDTIFISFQSSLNWPANPQDVGSDLRIDNMYLASQKLPVSNFAVQSSGCKGEQIQLTDLSINLAGSWFWIAGGGTISNSGAENPTVTFNSAGTYNITMVASNAFGTGAPITKSISIHGLPNVTATSDNICAGDSATLSASGAATYLWSTGDTTADIKVTPASTKLYVVVGKSIYGCANSAVSAVVIPITPKPDICMVTADDASMNNIIYWDKSTYGALVDSFIIYRETSSNIYKQIGAVAYADSSKFIDTVRVKYFPNTGDPNKGTYRYKIQIRDTCGSYGPLSAYHNTVYVLYSGGNSGQFFWTDKYLIDGVGNPVNNYVLICDSANTGSWFTVGSVAGTQSTIVDNVYAANNSKYPNAKWRVVTQWGITCSSDTKTTTVLKSRSNIKDNLIAVGINNTVANTARFFAYPNPAKDILYVNIPDNIHQCTAVFVNLLGESVLCQQINGAISPISLNGLAKGVYYLKVYDSNNSVLGFQRVVVY